MLVATSSFTDPSDGQWITEGTTYIHESADVARSHPQNFRPATGRGSGSIDRLGGTVGLGKPRPRQRAPKRPAKKKLLPFGYPSSDVVIRARSTELTQFTVTLGSGARRTIEDELALVRRELGPDYEAGGWLYGQYRPRESSDWQTIAVATHAGNSEYGRSSITFGESATSLMLRSFPPELGHMKHLGDWHSHPTRGSTIPSEGDARGWARSLDEYGFARYTAIIVSPSEGMGWMSPVFSAWTVRREGVPSLPVCEPAKLVG
jgi:Prokaryotic homologs of the JAB domain